MRTRRKVVSVELRNYEAVISWWHRHCTIVSNWNCRIQFETARRRDNAFRARRRIFCENPPAVHRSASLVSHVICLRNGLCLHSMSIHPKYTAWCLLQEASDVDRRSCVDWGFRCRLRPSRLDVDKTEARHEKSSWRLSISGRHIARRAARVSDCLGRRRRRNKAALMRRIEPAQEPLALP
jgi:hypothetical protein